MSWMTVGTLVAFAVVGGCAMPVQAQEPYVYRAVSTGSGSGP